jgi:predicted TIM-barrel fold metal-dependent hydrolase
MNCGCPRASNGGPIMTTLEVPQSSTMAPDEPNVDYALYDADQHYYEPQDCLTRYLEKPYQRIIKWAEVGGRTTVIIHGKQLTVVPNPTYDPVGVPGSLETYFRAANQEGRELRDIVKMQPIAPEARDRAKRIERLDAQGVEQTWLIPSLGLGVEEMLQEDPESAIAIFRAYNRWLDDDWGYDRDGRILTGPMISLIDAEAAEAEVDRVLEIGTKMVIMRAGPVASMHGRPKSPADPSYDGVWARLAEAGVVVAIHAGDAGYTKYLADWGESPKYMGMKASPLTEVLGVGVDRPIYDMMSAMICHGLFDRHPTLKVATLELGAAWVPELHRRLRVAYGKSPQSFGRDPIESFREHVWVAPFYEDSIATLRDIHGADRVLLGSDWPHPEGLSEPRKWIADFVELGEADMRLALRDNQRALTGS